MASLVLSGDTSGSITVSAPAVAGSTTQTLVNVTGTLAPIVSGTAVTASGTSVDFTGIPSWVKRITVMLNGVSFAAAGAARVRIGSGSLETTGYTSIVNTFGTGVVTSTFTDGIGTAVTSAAATTVSGVFSLVLLNSNTWVSTGFVGRNADANTNFSQGSITLSGTLSNLSLVAATSTFDAGTINILYE